MMRCRGAALAMIFLFLAAAPAQGERGDAGSTAAVFLRLQSGAEAAAQGEAFTARATGLEAFPYNPAGLTGAGRHEISLQHHDYLLDLDAEYAAVLLRHDGWAVAGSFFYLDEGRQTRRTISNPAGSLGTFSNHAFAATLGAARRLENGLSYGLSARFFREDLAGVKGDGVSGDLGLHYRLRELPIQFGLAARNLGSNIRFDRDREEIPTELALGGAGDFWRDRATVSAEIAIPRDQEPEYRIGFEFRPIPSLALRTGYNTRNDAGGLSAGAGFRIRDFTLDYAWNDYGDFGDAHRVGLKFRFGE